MEASFPGAFTERLPTVNLERFRYSQLLPSEGLIVKGPSLFSRLPLRWIISGFGLCLVLAILYRSGVGRSSSHFIFQSDQIDSLLASSAVDWSRFAYTQYVTTDDYLCNSVMIFAKLEELGSKPDRVMMYPNYMHPNSSDESKSSELLIKARDQYRAKLVPVEVLHKSNTESK